MPASVMASEAAAANNSALVRSCLPNLVTPAPITATRRIGDSLKTLILRYPASYRAAAPNGRESPGERGRVSRMTVEEALLAVVGLIALVLLFLGLADALEGDPRAWWRGRRGRVATRAIPRPAP